jgi:DNA-binding response OmpR family regulator
MAALATPTFLRNRTRILIASADASLRQRVKKNPLYAESDSEEAVGGAHALAKLLQFPCDSVLLDRNLADLDASEVAEQIRKQFRVSRSSCLTHASPASIHRASKINRDSS